MRYFSEETVKKIMQKVEVKEIQCNVYDNLYSVQRIYPNLDNFESIDIAEPHGELVSRDWILNYFDDAYCLATKLDYEDAVAIVSNKKAIPTILEASKEN